MAGPLGELEQLLLLALLRLEGEASGADLREELEHRIGRTVLPGAVYTIMERMVERGLIGAFTTDSAPARGGRPRKYYRMRRAGERALAESYQQVRGMAAGLDERLRRLGESG